MGKFATLDRKSYKFALKLQKLGLKPAAVIVAGKSYFKKNGRSRPPSPYINSDKLRIQLSSLGELYTRVNGNYLGCCAEIDAADHVMSKLRDLKPDEVNFSDARRPRTMQIVPPCKNCKSTFSL